MTRLLVLTEGQSEDIFVRTVLAPHLQQQKNAVFVDSILLAGVVPWSKIAKKLRPLLHEKNSWVTTLLDFYGFPKDMPGYEICKTTSHPKEQVALLQKQLAKNVTETFKHARFIPFLSLHEFEAWLFCDPEKVASHFAENEAQRLNIFNAIDQAVKDSGEPERINSHKDTHPKAHLKSIIPTYKETSDGPILMKKIGLSTIRQYCPHFAAWLSQLEALGEKSPSELIP